MYKIFGFLLFLFVSANAFAESRMFGPGEIIENGCVFENIGVYENSVTLSAVYMCDPGYYLPKNQLECRLCEPGYYCPGNVEVMLSDSDSGIQNCPDGLVSAAGTATEGGCGVAMHVGNDVLLLTKERQTMPALAARVDGEVYYARMTPVVEGVKKMNSETQTEMRAKVDNIEYSIHDNTVKGEE